MPETTTRVMKVVTVMVPVADQDRALRFYVDVLGFEQRTDIPYGEGNAERWIEVGPPGAETTLALTLQREGWDVGRMTGVSLVSEDIDALHAHLTQHGVDCDPVMRMDGPPPPMFFFRDGDGNSLLIVEG